VLVRLVRLSIETNALTGTRLSEILFSVVSKLCLAALAITALVLYAVFPVRRIEKRYVPVFDSITFYRTRSITYTRMFSWSVAAHPFG